MAREDLLALTTDDLAALTNRGTVKRAEREFASGDLTAEIHDQDDLLRFVWSDGTECSFPPGASLADAHCSSGATGISRHVVRSVFAYQAFAKTKALPDAEVADVEVADAKTPEDADSQAAADLPIPKGPANPWDPGECTDQQLIDRFGKRSVSRAASQWKDGATVELLRGAKPLARFLDRPGVVRFLVPHDLRYVFSDVAETNLSLLVCFAVWSFRRLDASKPSGILSTQSADANFPEDIAKAIRSLVVELVTDGFAGVAKDWPDRMLRCQQTAREAQLVWPADLISELLEQHAAYVNGDARFDPLTCVRAVGELLIRLGASNQQPMAVPRTLVLGNRNDITREVSGARLIGIGCKADSRGGVSTLTAFVQDASTGVTMSVMRNFTDPQDAAPRDFSNLATASIYKGFSIASIASGQVVMKSAKRSPANVLTLPRSAGSATVNPQTFAWEALQPPNTLDDFAEVRARLQMLPPSSLRPRRTTENIFVVGIRRAEEVRFDPATQKLNALIFDQRGDKATLQMPYHSQAHSGFERLASVLRTHSEDLLFVSAEMRLSRDQLELRPLAIVYSVEGRRFACMPWVDKAADSEDQQVELASDFDAEAVNEIDAFMNRWHHATADLLTTGIRDSGTRSASQWLELSQIAAGLGMTRFEASIRQTADALQAVREQTEWQPSNVANTLLPQYIMLRVSQDTHC